MGMRPNAYVGVSGFVSRSEVEAALAAFPDCGRQLMAGVLVSQKTLAGQRNRWWRRYPRVDDIAGIFVDDQRCLNLVHYASDVAPDADTLLRIFWLAGPLCHGFQFNGTWPLVGALAVLLRAYEGSWRTPRIVMQANPSLVRHDPDARVLAAQVWVYDGMISDVLLDASGGYGEPIDPMRAAMFVAGLRQDLPDLGIGIAGGLCAETLPGVAHLIRNGASCDAEGKIRDDADGGGRLVQAKVEAYLRAAGEATGS